MDGDNHPSRVALLERRDETIDRLTAAFTRDVLGLDEFEDRVEKAHAAQTTEALVPLTHDLPAEVPTPAPVPRPVAAPAPAPAPSRLPVVARRESQTVVAVMGGSVRKGEWTPAATVRAVAVMGGTVLDFREAKLPAGVTEVQAFALMGGVEIIVPPGLAVTSDGIGIMGGFEGLDQAQATDGEDCPRLHIKGIALMGGVEVVSSLPGETSIQALAAESENRRPFEVSTNRSAHGRHGAS